MNTMMRIPLITLISSFLITLVTAETGFQDPEVALTCSSGPTNNIVSVTWSPVHEDHDSVAEILKSERFQFCKVEIHCENGYEKVVNQCRGDKVEQVYEWRSVPKSENFCSVTVKYRDFYDSDRTVLSTKKNCDPSIVLSTLSKNITVLLGTAFNISFQYYAVPPSSFTWYINDEFYETVIGTTSYGTDAMVFNDARQGGLYRCVVENEFGIDEDTVFLDILGSPTITEGPINIADTIGGSVTFTCTAIGIPLPIITWSSDSNNSIVATSDMILDNITIQSSLTLLNLQSDDFKNYTCAAVNEDGSDSGTAVLGMIPKILHGPQSISELQGKVANFNCSASGIPPPTILWTFTNNNNEVTALGSTRNNKTSENVMGELDLLDVTKDKFGTYSCVAVNIFDTDTKAATLVLKSIVGSDTPIDRNTTDVPPNPTDLPTISSVPAFTPSPSVPPSVPPSNTSSSSQTIIIILSIATFIIFFVITVISLGVAVYRWRRKSFLSNDATKYMMLVVDSDGYYLSVGRDAASTIETLSVNEEVIKWIQETELQTNDEGCRSVVTYSTTNEEMLNYVQGYKNSSHKSQRHQILSDSILSSRYHQAKHDYQKSKHLTNINDTIIEESIREPSHININQELAAVKTSSTKTSIQENSNFSSISDSSNHLSGHSIQGQYMDYHTAVDLTVDSGHGSISSQPQDFTSPITEYAIFPADNDSVFLYSPSDGNYVDHGIAFSIDSTTQSVNSAVGHPESPSISPYTGDANTLHDTSMSDDHCTTPTTGVYQSHNTAVNHDDITANGLQLI